MGVFDPKVYGAPVFDDLLIDPEVYGESPLADSVISVTVADSLATLTESVSRVATMVRAVAASLSTLTEVVTRTGSYLRAVADAIATLSESVSSVAAYTRSAADSVLSITETVVRAAMSMVRTISDAIASISESVEAQVATIIRTVADSISSITESASRVWSGSRLMADTISTISEAIVRIAALIRAATESIASITESVSRTLGALARTAADLVSSATESVSRTLTLPRTVATTLGAVTEAVSRVATMPRTVSATIATLTESVNRSVAKSRTVADSISSISAVATRVATVLRGLAELVPIVREYINGTLPYVPDAPTVVDLLIDGTSVWADTQFELAHFISQVNGVAGTCEFRVRDLDRTRAFVVGQEILLTINGLNVWRGFVAMVNRIYVFPALNVDDFGLARFIDIRGVDINILLTKRIVFDQSTPANVLAPLLPPATADVTAIDLLLAGWLDLSGDGLDTTTLVENVADTTWTQEGRPWEGSDTWAGAMQSIANLPAAIYYINPDKQFVYTDVNTPSAPFALSDTPLFSGLSSFGYREMEILNDGTGLANDVMAWGIGYGSQTPVFVRDIDATSVTDHGVWQLGQTSFGVFEQATINRIAESIIDGSPSSKRGAKDDRVSVQCVTYQHGLRVADKVDFTSNVFGFNDVIPIRKMEVEFPTPTDPKYSLTLSHEIDTPFGFFDNFWYDFTLGKGPKFRCPPGMVRGPGGMCIWPPIIGEAGCDCGITDSFTRVVADGWGQSDAQINWVTSTNGLPDLMSVDGSRAVSFATADSTGIVTADISWASTGTDSLLFTGIQIQVSADPTFNGYSLSISPDTNFAAYKVLLGYFDYGSGPVKQWFFYDASGVHDIGQPPPFDIFSPFSIRMEASAAYFRVKGWATSSAEPGAWSWESSNPDSAYVGGDLEWFVRNFDSGGTEFTVYLDSIDITGVNRCTAVQFDNFDRTVINAWGVSIPAGHAWTNLVDTYIVDSFGVDGSSAYWDHTATRNYAYAGQDWDVDTAPWGGNAFTMHTRFQFSYLSLDTDKLYFIIQSDYLNYIEIILAHNNNAGAGGAGFVQTINSQGGGATVAKTDWVAGVWYRVTWDYSKGLFNRAKVWEESGPEPVSWTVDGSDSGLVDFAGTATNISVNSNQVNIPSAETILIDSIDFDYAGRPCYLTESCSTSTFDDFNRALAGSFGTASPSGETWIPVTTPGGTDWGVNGSELFVGTTGGTIRIKTPADIAPWQTEDIVEFLTRFHFHQDTGIFTNFGSFMMELRDGSGNNAGWLFQINGTGGGFNLYSSPSAGTTNYALPSAWSTIDYSGAAVWFGVRWKLKLSTGDISAKVWLETDGEPADWSVVAPAGYIQPLIAATAQFYIEMGSSFASRAEYVDYINFGSCASTPVSGGSGAPSTPVSGAYGCQNATRVTSTLYEVDLAFVAGTSTVYLNGRLMRLTYDYVEDNLSRSITFVMPVSSSDTVYVCYRAIGVSSWLLGI